MSVTPEAVRRLAVAAGLTDDSRSDWLGFSRDGKGVAWTFMGRDAPKAKRRPVIEVLAVRCALERKEHLIAAAPAIYFDDPHYRGYPAVLVQLRAVSAKELGTLLADAAAIQAAAPTRKRSAKKKAVKKTSAKRA